MVTRIAPLSISFLGKWVGRHYTESGLYISLSCSPRRRTRVHVALSLKTGGKKEAIEADLVLPSIHRILLKMKDEIYSQVRYPYLKGHEPCDKNYFPVIPDPRVYFKL